MLSPDPQTRGLCRLRNTPTIQRINRFLASPGYILLVCLLALVGNLFALELVVYSLYVALALYVFLLGEDLLPVMPLVILCYIVPSAGNNPGLSAQSVFSMERGGRYLLILAALMVVTLAARIITDRQWGGKAFFTKKRSLLPGFLLLTVAYLLSGIGSERYEALASKNVLFASMQICAIMLPYLLFIGGISWEKVRTDYFAWIGFGTGCVLLGQILWIYLTRNVVIDGSIERTLIFSGWGMYNNMGGLLAMMIPFAFCLASQPCRVWLGAVAGTAFLVGVLMTCSRSAILTGTGIYVLCVGLIIFSAGNRKRASIALLIALGVAAVALLVFHWQLSDLFRELLDRGLEPNSRDKIFRDGWNLFKQNPLLGNTFYPPPNMSWSWSTNAEFTSFFPARWHNTVIQLLASCGIAGMAAYLFHRLETLRLFLLNRTREKIYIGCSILVLLIAGMFDCHLFNIGPAMFYSMALAFAEYKK